MVLSNSQLFTITLLAVSISFLVYVFAWPPDPIYRHAVQAFAAGLALGIALAHREEKRT